MIEKGMGMSTITSVSYSRLRSFGNFENVSLSATASVGEAEDAQVALEGLRDWVHERLAEQIESADLRNRTEMLRYEVLEYERKIEQAQKRWSSILKFLDKLGIKRPGDIPNTLEELPF